MHNRYNQEDLYGKWIEIKKDKNGFLIYKPCDGETPFLIITEKEIKYYSQIEEPAIYLINSFKKQENKKLIYAKDNKGSTIFFTANLNQNNENYILWDWEINNIKYQMLTINMNESKKMRVIKNPCENDKAKELEFINAAENK
ncbi:hypothetical protein [uncultured Chryseobacterium sp.]|uniref:hypothetical protein n=1 Tax=uncultured Chryseobacterium sp. TaxID=259322 RepID=UPI0026208789|nr:hypothetical protein [uncultured Chryseobacterium sp.]